MKDSKSGLCIKQVISISIIFIILIAYIQVFSLKQETIQNASTNRLPIKMVIQNVEKQEIKVAQISQREEKVISRAGQERMTQEKVERENQEEEYITISEITISKNMDLTKKTGISKEDFKKLIVNLKTDTSGFFEKNSDTIYELCKKYELNELFFCGLIAAESGWNIAPNHRKTNNYISMMSKGKLIHYSSTSEGLEAAAKLLHNKYLSTNGSCYNGKTLSCVQKRFCPNSSTWVNLVYHCMNQIID